MLFRSDSMDDLPDRPLLLLGNEFLDALPIRQFVSDGRGWLERYVGPDGFVDVPVRPVAVSGLPGCAEAGVQEICEPARAIVAGLAARFGRHPGAALFLDYGPEHSGLGDSLQAIGNGQPADTLAPAGTVDLTAHVDFAALAAVARFAGASVHGPVPQGPFLARLGLFQRTNRLARQLPPAQAAAISRRPMRQ